MAAMALDGELRKSLLDRTDSEKAFRPWWDTLEDTLLNTLIALGNAQMVFCYQNCSDILWEKCSKGRIKSE